MNTVSVLRNDTIIQSSNTDLEVVDQYPTEMVLHMKGPIYSVAERSSEVNEFTQYQKRNRAYLVNADSDQFFRRPIQDYESLKVINPSISGR
jgi:hypothetical protein